MNTYLIEHKIQTLVQRGNRKSHLIAGPRCTISLEFSALCEQTSESSVCSRALAEIWSDKPFRHGGYEFWQWEFSWPVGGPGGKAWIAKREMRATSWIEAISAFRADLFRIVDRIAAVSQCHTMASAESFLVLRKNENRERIFLLRYSQARPPVPLAFDEQSVEALDKLDALGDKLHALHYLREATSATTFLTLVYVMRLCMDINSI